MILLGCPLRLAAAGTPKSHLRAAEVQAIRQGFRQILDGKSVAHWPQRRFRLSEVAGVQQEVWRLWQEAVSEIATNRLQPLIPLDQADSGSWHLPETLEPHAIMPYYWGYKGVQPKAGYPLFLYLHGSGERQAEWKTGLALCRGFDDAPSAYFIPQIPNTGGYYRWWQRSKQWAWEHLLRQALASGRIDANRFYVFGISEGGYGSQRLASFYADYWAAAGPMAGGEPLMNAPAENCRHIGFSLLTGANDEGFYRNVLTHYAAAAFDSLQSAYPCNYRHRIDLIPGRGHGIDYRPTTPWLKAFVRTPQPTAFCWEDFEMDGRHRDGFYNLLVLQRSDSTLAARTYYQMDIRNNQVQLRVDEIVYRAIETDPRWGIGLRFARQRRPASRGRITIFLSDSLIDLRKPVTVSVNGKQVFHGKLRLDLQNLTSSCAAYFDPERLFPAAVTVAW